MDDTAKAMSSRFFVDSRLKISRANKHIAELQEIALSLPGSYTVTIERDEKANRQEIKCVLPNPDSITSALALVIGDAVHNLRASLDYGWIGAVSRLAPSALTKFAKFPIFDTRAKLEGALKGIKIDEANPSLFKFIVSDLKSYSGGNEALYRLHRLDISDKHRLLIPTVQVFALNAITIEDEKGEISKGNTFPIKGTGPHYIPFEGEWHIKDKGTPAIAVVFENGLGLQDMEIVDMLRSFSQLAMYVVHALESL